VDAKFTALAEKIIKQGEAKVEQLKKSGDDARAASEASALAWFKQNRAVILDPAFIFRAEYVQNWKGAMTLHAFAVPDETPEHGQGGFMTLYVVDHGDYLDWVTGISRSANPASVSPSFSEP
jgi:hypothetical protein